MDGPSALAEEEEEPQISLSDSFDNDHDEDTTTTINRNNDQVDNNAVNTGATELPSSSSITYPSQQNSGVVATNKNNVQSLNNNFNNVNQNHFASSITGLSPQLQQSAFQPSFAAASSSYQGGNGVGVNNNFLPSTMTSSSSIPPQAGGGFSNIPFDPANGVVTANGGSSSFSTAMDYTNNNNTATTTSLNFSQLNPTNFNQQHQQQQLQQQQQQQILFQPTGQFDNVAIAAAARAVAASSTGTSSFASQQQPFQPQSSLSSLINNNNQQLNSLSNANADSSHRFQSNLQAIQNQQYHTHSSSVSSSKPDVTNDDPQRQVVREEASLVVDRQRQDESKPPSFPKPKGFLKEEDSPDIEMIRSISAEQRRLQQLKAAQEKNQVVEIMDCDDDDEDDDEETDNTNGDSHQNGSSKLSGVKRRRENDAVSDGTATTTSAAANQPSTHGQSTSQQSTSNPSLKSPPTSQPVQPPRNGLVVTPPQPITRYPWHKPTWTALLPTTQQIRRVFEEERRQEYERTSQKHYELSLLSVSEFTISGLPTGTFGTIPCKVQGLRKTIKECSRGHGTAVFEVDKDGASSENPDGGKWRIPIGAYSSFLNALRARPRTSVVPIPTHQLNVASMGKRRQDKGFPSTWKILNLGVPPGLACALADFQRGGVDFVAEKGGRALIADDMGLGKTVQSIASMSAFHEDWPLLVLTPSSARYHWQSEFNKWLGQDSAINQEEKIEQDLDKLDDDNDEDDVVVEPKVTCRLLHPLEINVLKSGKNQLLHPRTRVVICSYGLAPSLVANNLLFPGMFKSVIVDESHYLKSMKTKRTQSLIPILRHSKRCVLLSGTPALARPSELWPQLLALAGTDGGWWKNETDFFSKYVTRSSAARRAELHTMLTGTLMIRRLKGDMLKNLPKKQREKAVVHVTDDSDRREFHRCMELLRQGKGVMAKIAQNHSAFAGMGAPVPIDENSPEFVELKSEYKKRMNDELRNVEEASEAIEQNDASYDKENWKRGQKAKIEAELDKWYNQRVHEINQNAQIREDGLDDDLSRKAVLNRMYSMTAKVKVPLVVKMLRQWLADPTNGKLCIFAHHIYVLDEIVKQAGLSNDSESGAQYIRIDGSTSPQERQNQIQKFQDPRNTSIRVAVLGITAAGIAVTLTASSTVWFAELFWTPALMIQAEDRVHRIGQTAPVKILYIVANGTLDLLLWSLLEKKFRALGEFVEGQEKMKIVVQRTYESNEELEKQYFSQSRGKNSSDDDDEGESEDEGSFKVAGSADAENEQDGKDLIQFESQLGQEINELEQEEMDLLKSADEDDGDGTDGRDGNDESHNGEKRNKVGFSEENAIDLDDDTNSKKRSADLVAGASASSTASGTTFDHRSPDAFAGCRYYLQTYSNPCGRFGLELTPWEGRIVVISNQHKMQSKPEVGDLLVAVNDVQVPYPANLTSVLTFMTAEIAKGPVRLLMVDGGAEWKGVFPGMLAELLEKRNQQMQAQLQFEQDRRRFFQKSNKGSSDEVIELLDDSDDE